MANLDVNPQQGRPRNLLNEEYTIDTPENVTFSYEVAGIGSRMIGALVDTLILLGVQILFFILMMIIGAFVEGSENAVAALVDESEPSWISGLLFAAYALISFLLFWGYYILFEHIWNGQTPGKRVAGTRVVRMDGSPISLLSNVIRNLVRLIDLMPTAYALGVIVMFCNRHARRIGDFAAGTMVVKDQKPLTLDSLKTESRQMELSTDELSSLMQVPRVVPETVLQQYPLLAELTDSDYELMTEALEREKMGQLEVEYLHRLTEVIATKIGYSGPQTRQLRIFLREVADAYSQYHRA